MVYYKNLKMEKLIGELFEIAFYYASYIEFYYVFCFIKGNNIRTNISLFNVVYRRISKFEGWNDFSKKLIQNH